MLRWCNQSVPGTLGCIVIARTHAASEARLLPSLDCFLTERRNYAEVVAVHAYHYVVQRHMRQGDTARNSALTSERPVSPNVHQADARLRG